VLDSILLAYRLAEDKRVLLPVMVCQDAFVLSHTMMMTDVPRRSRWTRSCPPSICRTACAIARA
jgi:pyruvate/2-oxoacid:ferredoxin oxidoreductase alpha subunit